MPNCKKLMEMQQCWDIGERQIIYGVKTLIQFLFLS
jgi:hypothetical protein